MVVLFSAENCSWIYNRCSELETQATLRLSDLQMRCSDLMGWEVARLVASQRTSSWYTLFKDYYSEFLFPMKCIWVWLGGLRYSMIYEGAFVKRSVVPLSQCNDLVYPSVFRGRSFVFIQNEKSLNRVLKIKIENQNYNTCSVWNLQIY